MSTLFQLNLSLNSYQNAIHELSNFIGNEDVVILMGNSVCHATEIINQFYLMNQANDLKLKYYLLQSCFESLNPVNQNRIKTEILDKSKDIIWITDQQWVQMIHQSERVININS